MCNGCLGLLGLAASSAGYYDGKHAEVTLSYRGSPFSYDASWMSTGFNVVVFSRHTNEVLATKTFDVRRGLGGEMLAYLEGSVEAGDLVVVLGDTFVESPDARRPFVTEELAAFMADSLGARTFGLINLVSSFRASYALVARKRAAGAAAAAEALAELFAPEREGPAVVNATVPCPEACPTPAPTAASYAAITPPFPFPVAS